MSYVKALVPIVQNDGRDDVSLTLTYKGVTYDYKGVTYDATGYIANLTITQDYDTGGFSARFVPRKQTLTLVLEDAQVVATVRPKELAR